MFPHRRRIRRNLRRFFRPVFALLLVLAQCVGAFGYPVVVRHGETIRKCGCKVRGPSEVCCCSPRECCGGITGEAIPEPETPKCPMCKVKQAAKAPVGESQSNTIVWTFGVKARQCHGESALGLIAEFPAIPPTMPSRSLAALIPVGFVDTDNFDLLSHDSIPPDPPPRCG
jgi:hypothetical protein